MESKNGFEIKHIFLAYVPPFYEEDQPFELETLILKKESKTTEYLLKIFDSALDEARIEITFNSDDSQQNEVRNDILSITQKETIPKKTTHSKKLAQRLYKETDERNGKGLFCIIEGVKGRTTRIVLIRFKGDEGLINHGKKLLVDYISEVFTKKSNHYKLAVYEDIISTKSFWKGYSVDKQISGSSYKPISFFWVESFLNSKTALTPAQGTMQFSKVIRAILLKATDLSEQEEIISGIVNLRTKKNKQMSVSDFCKTYLSPTLANKVQEETKDDFFNSVFLVDNDVYKKEFGKTVLSLQDGITAFVPTFSYEKHVTETINRDGSKNVVIEGKLNGKKINIQPTEKTNQDAPRLRPNKK